MQKIKSFIYLDEYKMYSISSQIFEGITESLMSYQGSTTEKEEEQKGEFGSGRIMADILRSESGTQKKSIFMIILTRFLKNNLGDWIKFLVFQQRTLTKRLSKLITLVSLK